MLFISHYIHFIFIFYLFLSHLIYFKFVICIFCFCGNYDACLSFCFVFCFFSFLSHVIACISSVCMHAFGPPVHVRVGLWMMTILWGCAGSCLNPQTHSTSGAEPCPWSPSMMRVRHTHLQTLNQSRHTYVKIGRIYITNSDFFPPMCGYDPRTCKREKNTRIPIFSDWF